MTRAFTNRRYLDAVEDHVVSHGAYVTALRAR